MSRLRRVTLDNPARVQQIEPMLRRNAAHQLLGCALFALSAACNTSPPDAQRKAADKSKASPPVTVVVERLSARPFKSEQTFSGEVWAVSDAALTVGEAGRVRKVYVAEGERVSKGQLLLELEDGLAQAELGRARATQERVEVQHLQASREASRFAALSQEQLATERDTQRGQSQAQALWADQVGARAAVNVMSQHVQRHRITAPFDGTVAQRRADPGDWLTPGEPALELLTDARVEVLVHVPPWLLDQSRPGASAQLVIGSRHTPAHVTHSVPALDRKTRTALVRLSPDRRPDWLRPGANVQVVFQVQRNDGFTVPRDALVYGLAGVRVFRKVAEKAEPSHVKVLQTAGDQALVESKELSIGDQLIVRGNERLRPGQSVTLENAVSGYLSPADNSASEPTR